MVRRRKAWLIPLTGDSCEMLLSNLYNTRLFNVDECRVDLCDFERNINAEITKIKEALMVRRYSPHTVEELSNIVHAKKNPRIPVVFSREEIKLIIENLRGQKNCVQSLCTGQALG